MGFGLWLTFLTCHLIKTLFIDVNWEETKYVNHMLHGGKNTFFLDAMGECIGAPDHVETIHLEDINALFSYSKNVKYVILNPPSAGRNVLLS